jgi:DNA-binding LacI/PurR family transcriptional regulator
VAETNNALRSQGPRPHRPDPAAPHGAVSVVIAEPTVRLFGDPFFAPLIQGVQEVLAERSIVLVVFGLSAGREQDHVEAYLASRRVDGVILASLRGESLLPAHLAALDIPTVICGRAPRNARLSYVDTDNRQGAALAVNHLISLGRRRISLICGSLDMPAAADRFDGYREALAFAGIPPDPTLVETADFALDAAEASMERLLAAHPDINGVFATSDLQAAGALEVIQRSGRKVPDDVAVIGFDDTPTARAATPPLSSIRQPIQEMGREAASILVREMGDPDPLPRQVIFATELVARESTIGTTRRSPRRRR